MDELENQTIRQWRDSEKSVTTLKSTLVQIDPGQRYRPSQFSKLGMWNMCLSIF